MSEIREKAHNKVYEIVIANRHNTELGSHALVDQILSIPELNKGLELYEKEQTNAKTSR